MTPLTHLYSIAAITLCAYAISRYDRSRHARVLRRVAAELDMNYSPVDPFGLADKIVDRFPVPGAARLEVSDLVYGMQGNRYRYIFTAHFTIGAVRAKRRASRVTFYSELATPGGKSGAAPAGELRVASQSLTWADQYRSLGKA